MSIQAAHPDIEPAVVGYALVAVPGVHSCIELPPGEEFNDLLPVAQFTRIGGLSSRGTWSHGDLLDRPTITVDVYASSREAANEAVRLLRQAMGAIRGTVRDGVGFISSRETAGPGYRPEASQNVTRIGFTVELTVRPVPAG